VVRGENDDGIVGNVFVLERPHQPPEGAVEIRDRAKVAWRLSAVIPVPGGGMPLGQQWVPAINGLVLLGSRVLMTRPVLAPAFAASSDVVRRAPVHPEQKRLARRAFPVGVANVPRSDLRFVIHLPSVADFMVHALRVHVLQRDVVVLAAMAVPVSKPHAARAGRGVAIVHVPDAIGLLVVVEMPLADQSGVVPLGRGALGKGVLLHRQALPVEEHVDPRGFAHNGSWMLARKEAGASGRAQRTVRDGAVEGRSLTAKSVQVRREHGVGSGQAKRLSTPAVGHDDEDVGFHRGGWLVSRTGESERR